MVRFRLMANKFVIARSSMRGAKQHARCVSYSPPKHLTRRWSWPRAAVISHFPWVQPAYPLPGAPSLAAAHLVLVRWFRDDRASALEPYRIWCPCSCRGRIYDAVGISPRIADASRYQPDSPLSQGLPFPWTVWNRLWPLAPSFMRAAVSLQKLAFHVFHASHNLPINHAMESLEFGFAF